jgi:hypothetical protein
MEERKALWESRGLGEEQDAQMSDTVIGGLAEDSSTAA